MVIICTAVVNSYDLLAQFACKGQVCYTSPKWLQLSTFWILMQGSTVDLFRCSEIRTRVRRFSMSIMFFGKYRGQVIDNLDPEQIGRLLVSVPDAFSGKTSWAMPCVPFAGNQSGFFALPPRGANVWVEFERGEVDYPVWSGCFWATRAEVPVLALSAPGEKPVVIESAKGTILVLGNVSDPMGGILLKTPSGAAINITDSGITINNGQGATIVLEGKSVVVNNVPLNPP